MLPGIAAHAGFADSAGSMRETIDMLGLNTNLKLCLDAGDSASVASASQTKWLDVSGSGNDFFRGTSATATTDDPTFHGAVGYRGPNEYYSFDGGDYFNYDGTVQTWMSALHKNSAAGSFAFWFYPPTSAFDGWMFSTWDGSSVDGVEFEVTLQTAYFNVHNAADGFVFNAANSANLPLVAARWNFVAFTMNEASNTCFFQGNGYQEQMACTYVAPGTGNAKPMAIGALPGPANKFMSGSRLAQVAMWQGTAITQTQMSNLYQATRTKFGV